MGCGRKNFGQIVAGTHLQAAIGDLYELRAGSPCVAAEGDAHAAIGLVDAGDDAGALAPLVFVGAQFVVAAVAQVRADCQRLAAGGGECLQVVHVVVGQVGAVS